MFFFSTPPPYYSGLNLLFLRKKKPSKSCGTKSAVQPAWRFLVTHSHQPSTSTPSSANTDRWDCCIFVSPLSTKKRGKLFHFPPARLFYDAGKCNFWMEMVIIGFSLNLLPVGLGPTPGVVVSRVTSPAQKEMVMRRTLCRLQLAGLKGFREKVKTVFWVLFWRLEKWIAFGYSDCLNYFKSSCLSSFFKSTSEIILIIWKIPKFCMQPIKFI